MTKEQAMQALEQAGRKGSDAYAELAALEKQTPSGIKETTPTKEVSTSENKIKSWIDKWEELKKKTIMSNLIYFIIK